MQIITPNGRLKKVRSITPLAETAFKFNGVNRRVLEKASIGVDPTALYIVYDEQGAFGMSTDGVGIGNLKAGQAKEIIREIGEKGFYDFSRLTYQNCKLYDDTVFDNGESLPYTSDTGYFASNMAICLGIFGEPPINRTLNSQNNDIFADNSDCDGYEDCGDEYEDCGDDDEYDNEEGDEYSDED